MGMSITVDGFTNNKNFIVQSLSEQVGVAFEFIALEIITYRRSIRRKLSQLEVEVKMQTHDASSVEALVNDHEFASHLGSRISNKVGFTVTITEVSEPTTEIICNI